jgi:hypothetical protein
MTTKTLLFTLAVALAAGALPAQAAGVGETCGGIAAIQCDAGLACRYEAGQCSTSDLAGACASVPETCPKGGQQVCGCDGKTYANECEIMKAGVAPDHNGACTAAVKEKKPPAGSRRG